MKTEFTSDREKKNYFNRMSEAQRIDAFRTMLTWAGHAVFLGGAGVSTESGIPDFRSRNGLYHRTAKRFSRYAPEYLLSNDCLCNEPEVFFDYYRHNLDARAVQPNAAHLRLAEWEASGLLDGIVTQNIDGLHQAAGSENVLELHGSIQRAYCSRCRKSFDADLMNHGTGVPRCGCGGVIRPDIVLYEEALDQDVMRAAIQYIRNADVLIVGGTSLKVYPAAGLINYYRGDKLVLITRSSTPAEADLVIHGKIGEVFSQV